VVLVLHLHFLELQLHTVVAVAEDQEISTALQQQVVVRVMEHVPVQRTLVVAVQIAPLQAEVVGAEL
jgi:hypothetical protein